MANAETNFNLFKSFLEKGEWSFRPFEDDGIYFIETGVNTESMKIPFSLSFVDEDIIFNSRLPFKAQEDFSEVARELTKINSEYIKYGKFELDFEDGEILFSLYSMTDGIEISDEMIKKIIVASCITIDKFAPQLQKIVL